MSKILQGFQPCYLKFDWIKIERDIRDIKEILKRY